MKEWTIRVSWLSPFLYRDFIVYAETEEEALEYAETEAASCFVSNVQDVVYCEED